jgi:hypothetical protein
VCQFFRTAEDLSEVLIPYFKTGLERHEACVWVTSDPYGSERARSEMRAAMADFDRFANGDQIQIFGHDEWYTKHGTLNAAETIQGWLSRKDEAIAAGYAGLRVSGNASFVDENTWDEFRLYEQAADTAFKDQPIVALCSYCLDKCSGKAVLDVMQGHGFGLAKRHGRWQRIESWLHDHLHSCVDTHGHLLPRPNALSATSSRQEPSLVEIAEERLGSYMLAYPERITLEGGHVPLPASSAAKLRVVMLELAANCARFGAFATPQGNLAVKWRVAVNGSRRLHITWTESGMSNLTIPDSVGHGSQVLALAVENCVRIFEPTGMTCTFELNL